ncbi:MAG: NAD(P)H-dependent oxidoreductase [Dehalococcoidia bacterium]|nr:NAD(P)H-dependent oxidoreductase [Dehalococcoidia bacterium]
MPPTYRVAVLAGSLRRDAYSKKLAHALTRLASPALEFRHIEFGDLPLYNEDLDTSRHLPAAWDTFRSELRDCDAVLFVTPEYNRSIPGGLKNALDVGSRPYGESSWAGKPAAVVSISPGAISGFGANHHLRQALVFLDCPTMAQPEAYIGGAAELFDSRGEITNPGTARFLEGFMQAFAEWVRTNARVPVAA